MRSSASDSTHAHTHTPLYKASSSEGWRTMRKGHVFNICQMTEHPTVHLPVLKYPFGHSLSTVSIKEASHHPFLSPYPDSSPQSHPLTSWTALWILFPISPCRCAEQFRPFQVLLPNAWRCSTHNSITGYRDPLPQRDNVVIHITVPSHSIHFPRLGFFNLFKTFCIFFTFCQRPSNIFAASVSHFIDITNLFAPQMEILQDTFILHNLTDC